MKAASLLDPADYDSNEVPGYIGKGKKKSA
jgi:hypothetical protein